MLVSVNVKTSGDSLSFDTPTPLFPLGNRDFIGPGVRAQYDVSPDGERFVVNVNSDGEPQRVRMILDWFDELNRLVPTP